MIYVLETGGRIGMMLRPPIAPNELGELFPEAYPGWTLLTCQVIELAGQRFQMFYRAGHDGEVNQAASQINRSCGDEECIHGTVIMLSGPHLFDDDVIDKFSDQDWGNA